MLNIGRWQLAFLLCATSLRADKTNLYIFFRTLIYLTMSIDSLTLLRGSFPEAVNNQFVSATFTIFFKGFYIILQTALLSRLRTNFVSFSSHREPPNEKVFL